MFSAMLLGLLLLSTRNNIFGSKYYYLFFLPIDAKLFPVFSSMNKAAIIIYV